MAKSKTPTHIVIWPKARVTVDGKSVIVNKGEGVPDGVSAVDLDNLVSFGAIAGVTGLPETDAPADDDGKEPTVKEILADVGDDPEKAKAALAAEQEARGDKARKTLVDPLQAVIDGAKA